MVRGASEEAQQHVYGDAKGDAGDCDCRDAGRSVADAAANTVNTDNLAANLANVDDLAAVNSVANTANVDNTAVNSSSANNAATPVISRANGVGLRRVLTYGTFDLLHYGHVRLLQRAAALGDYLIVALSTDEFNLSKGKHSFYPYEVRREMLESVRYVDLVIPENSWEQKRDDVRNYHVDVVCMGADWQGDPRFEHLRDICDVVYLDRTEGISTTDVKHRLSDGKLL